MENKDPWTENSVKAEAALVAEKPATKYLDGPMDYLVFIFAFICGLLIWLLSPELTGHQEPWDSGKPTYYFVLFVLGFIFGAIKPERSSRWAMAIFIGQLIGLVFIGMGAFIILGVIFLAVLSLIPLLGTAISASLVISLKKSRQN